MEREPRRGDAVIYRYRTHEFVEAIIGPTIMIGFFGYMLQFGWVIGNWVLIVFSSLLVGAVCWQRSAFWLSDEPAARQRSVVIDKPLRRVAVSERSFLRHQTTVEIRASMVRDVVIRPCRDDGFDVEEVVIALADGRERRIDWGASGDMLRMLARDLADGLGVPIRELSGPAAGA